MKFREMEDYCESMRDPETRFCSVSNGCSGSSPSNLACDFDGTQEPGKHYRGGSYGSCHFVIEEEK